MIPEPAAYTIAGTVVAVCVAAILRRRRHPGRQLPWNANDGGDCGC